MEPQNRENSGKPERNEDGTFKKGFSGNPGGKPRNTLKKYVQDKLAYMTDEEKEAWLIEHKISGLDQWKMGEGNPENAVDLTSKGERFGSPILADALRAADDTVKNAKLNDA